MCIVNISHLVVCLFTLTGIFWWIGVTDFNVPFVSFSLWFLLLWPVLNLLLPSRWWYSMIFFFSKRFIVLLFYIPGIYFYACCEVGGKIFFFFNVGIQLIQYHCWENHPSSLRCPLGHVLSICIYLCFWAFYFLLFAGLPILYQYYSLNFCPLAGKQVLQYCFSLRLFWFLTLHFHRNFRINCSTHTHTHITLHFDWDCIEFIDQFGVRSHL